LGKDLESFLQAQRTFFDEPRVVVVVVVVVAVAGAVDARIAVAIVAKWRREGIARVAVDNSRRARSLGEKLGL
jgi:hypothetical protein